MSVVLGTVFGIKITVELAAVVVGLVGTAITGGPKPPDDYKDVGYLAKFGYAVHMKESVHKAAARM